MTKVPRPAARGPVQDALIQPAEIDPRLANASIVCCGNALPVLIPDTGVQCPTCKVIYTATLPAPTPKARPRRGR